MRHAARSVRILSLAFAVALAACGSSGGGGKDAAGGSGGQAGGSFDGAVDLAATDIEFIPYDSGAGGSDAQASTDGELDAEATDAGEADGGATDGGGAPDVDPASVCAAITVDAPAATETADDDGKAVDTAAFSGGPLASGTYWLTSVAHFGAGSYTGPTQEILVVDAAERTIEDASISGGTSTYRGFSFHTSSAALTGTALCGGASALAAVYTVLGAGAGATLSLNVNGTSDVKVFTQQ